MILVDTNVWSETIKDPCNPRVASWMSDHRDALWLSVIVMAEIRHGIELPKASARRQGLEIWFGRIVRATLTRTLDFDRDAAQVFGALMARRNAETKLLDLQIAAQALAHDIPVATRNVRDFEWTGVKLINPWDG